MTILTTIQDAILAEYRRGRNVAYVRLKPDQADKLRQVEHMLIINGQLHILGIPCVIAGTAAARNAGASGANVLDMARTLN